jgi:hypothetical protein
METEDMENLSYFITHVNLFILLGCNRKINFVTDKNS